MSNRNKIFIFCSGLILLLDTSCSITKKYELRFKDFDKSNLIESIIYENKQISNIIIFYSAIVSYNHVEQSITGQIRIIKDSAIWINANAKVGIEIGRALFTTNDFKIMIPTQKTVYEGSYSLAEKFLGSPLNFNSLQYALTGSLLAVENVFDFTEARIESGPSDDILMFSRNINYYTDVVIDSKTLKPKNIKIYRSIDPINLEIRFKNFITIDKIQLPQSMEIISIKNGNKNTKIEINYRKIESYREINIPFKIPGRYEIKKL